MYEHVGDCVCMPVYTCVCISMRMCFSVYEHIRNYASYLSALYTPVLIRQAFVEGISHVVSQMIINIGKNSTGKILHIHTNIDLYNCFSTPTHVHLCRHVCVCVILSERIYECIYLTPPPLAVCDTKSILKRSFPTLVA